MFFMLRHENTIKFNSHVKNVCNINNIRVAVYFWLVQSIRKDQQIIDYDLS